VTSKPGSSVTVRDARTGELDQVGRLLLSAYQEFAAHMPPDVWRAYASDITDVKGRLGDSELIVAQEGDRLVGAVTLYPDASRIKYTRWPTRWAYIRLLGVPPESRGKGIARLLMNECLRRCRSRGVPTVSLHTTALMHVAQGMYERMGFIRIPEYDFHPAPGVVVMAYRLDL